MQHGNEDTFREMLRIKRSVAAQFNTASNVAVFKAASEAQRTSSESQPDAMAAAEQQVRPCVYSL